MLLSKLKCVIDQAYYYKKKLLFIFSFRNSRPNMHINVFISIKMVLLLEKLSLFLLS